VIGRTPKSFAACRELERAVDAVVIGERERLIAELGRPRRELLGLRRPVEERVGGMCVQLDVQREQVFYTNTCSPVNVRIEERRPQAAGAGMMC